MPKKKLLFCQRGHEFTEQNSIYFRHGKSRSCRECRRLRAKSYNERRPKKPKRQFLKDTTIKVICGVCSKEFEVKYSKHPRRYCSRPCILKVTSNADTIIFNGNRYTLQTRGGYYTTNPNSSGEKKIRLHRAIWEHHNGPIPKGMVVHHKNRIKTDNRIENLELMGNREHSLMHGKRYKIAAEIKRLKKRKAELEAKQK